MVSQRDFLSEHKSGETMVAEYKQMQIQSRTSYILDHMCDLYTRGLELCSGTPGRLLRNVAHMPYITGMTRHALTTYLTR